MHLSNCPLEKATAMALLFMLKSVLLFADKCNYFVVEAGQVLQLKSLSFVFSI